MDRVFANISNFKNINDYLPILNGCVIADLIIIFMAFNGLLKSEYLKKWYNKFQLSAVIADVLILVIVIILARYFYKYIFNEFSIWKFTGFVVGIQILHDILFYVFFKNLPQGYNYMFDFFKGYAKEVGIGAIAGDSFMIIIACLLSSHFATYNVNTNIIILIVSVYLFPYLINY